MELRQLSYFKIIAETENISLASRRLHVSQPFLSRTIHNLEEELGVTLFDRKGRRISLNQNGKILYQYATKMLRLQNEAFAAIQKEKNNSPSVLNLAMLNTTRLFPEIIARFCEIHPDINFSITRFSSLDQIPDHCDIIIHASDSLASSTNSVVLFQEECLLGMSKNHPLANKEYITPEMLENETFLLLSQDNSLGELTRKYFKPLHLTPRVPIECDSQQTLEAFVEEGTGLAFFPCLTWKISNQTIVLRRIKDYTLTRNIYLSIMEDTPSQTVVTFRDYIIDNVKHIDSSL